MSDEEMLKQIESLFEDRDSFMDTTDIEEDNIFLKDEKALFLLVKKYKEQQKEINKKNKLIMEMSFVNGKLQCELKQLKEINYKLENELHDDYYKENYDLKSKIDDKINECNKQIEFFNKEIKLCNSKEDKTLLRKNKKKYVFLINFLKEIKE